MGNPHADCIRLEVAAPLQHRSVGVHSDELPLLILTGKRLNRPNIELSRVALLKPFSDVEALHVQTTGGGKRTWQDLDSLPWLLMDAWKDLETLRAHHDMRVRKLLGL
eukprot:241219-Amphidinium_carterae.1